MLRQATARLPCEENSFACACIRIVCILALSGVTSGRAPAGTVHAVAQVSTSVDNEVLSSNSFSRQLVQEEVNLFLTHNLQFLPASSGDVQLV